MLTINVSKKEIYNEVDRRLSIESSVLPDKYDFIWVGENRKELLEGFWVEGCETVVSIFKRYLNDATVEHSFTSYNVESVFELKAEMPERYSSLLDGSVITDVKMLIACNVVFGWLNSVMPDLAVKYKEESSGYADDLRSKILYRNSPSKTLSAAKLDNERTIEDELSLFQAKEDNVALHEEKEATLASAKKDAVSVTQLWEEKCKARFR